jgi:hypothetical protein
MTSIPLHPQLMDPITDPEYFIAASIYWHPLLFPNRTEVLDHTLLCNGNGYKWGDDGRIRSVFSHLDPGEDSLARYERDALEAGGRDRYDDAAYYRDEAAKLQVIRDDYQRLARTHGPVRVTEQIPGSLDRQRRMVTSRDLGWTLLGRVPEYVDPAWEAVLAEARQLFAPILIEQGALWD